MNGYVKFNGVIATVSSANPTKLVVRVPAGAATGFITVAVGTKTTSSVTPFTVTTAPFNGPPVITSFTPQIAAEGVAVTITGNNFDSTPVDNLVYFNLTRATVGSNTITRINTIVPTGATSSRLKVRTPTGTTVSNTDFFVVPPGHTPGDISVTQCITVNGSPVSINTGSAGKIAMILFDGMQGQYLGLGFSPVTLTGGSARLYIKTPGGADLISAESFSSAFSRDLPRLPETGTYVMLIIPSLSAVLDTTLTLYTDVPGVLVPNGPAKVFSTTRVGQNARYTFAGTAGQNLSLVLSGDIFPGYTYSYVYKPDGSQQTSTFLYYSSGAGSSAVLDLWNLPATGTYTVFITPTGTATGALTTTL